MALRCIIGHDYGEPQRTEEREERGDELVVTVREYRECRTCGHEKTISENTEVRTSEPADGRGPPGASDTPEYGEASDAPPGGTAEATGEASGGIGETSHPSVDPDGSAGDSTAGGAGGAGAAGDTGATPEDSPDATGDRGPAEDGDTDDVTAAEDDGVILEDDTADDERERGEWPGADGAEAEEGTGGEPARTGHGDWPTPDVEDEGYDAELSSGGPGESVEFGGGLKPERAESDAAAGGGSSPGDEDSNAKVGGQAANAGSGIARADAEPAARKPPAGSDAVLSCPRCGYTAPSLESSLRPGDICPDCGMGYLTEREE